jgi:Icc-related predicted phosphoesterase
MKILAISDEVLDALYTPKVRQTYPDIDLLIGCGDLPFYYLDFLVSALDAPLLYVRGNHDGGKQYLADGRTIGGVQGGMDIHGRVVREGNVLFAGLEGSIRYRPNRPFMYTEQEMRLQAMPLLPRLLLNRAKHGRGMDVMVTHSPPFGIHDRSDPAHVGFKFFLTVMRIFRPRYLLHGHIHRYRQDEIAVSTYYDTTVINVYPRLVLELKGIGARE